MKNIRAVRSGIAALAAVGVIAVSAYLAKDAGNADLSQTAEETGTEQTDSLPQSPTETELAEAINEVGLIDLPERPDLEDSERVFDIMKREYGYEAAPGEMDYLNITPLVERTPVLAEPVPAVTTAPAEPTSYMPVTHVPAEEPETSVSSDTEQEDAPEEEPDLLDEALIPEEEPDLTEATFTEEEVFYAPAEPAVEHVRLDLYAMDPTVGTGTISVPYTYYDFLTPEDIGITETETAAVTIEETAIQTTEVSASLTELASIASDKASAETEETTVTSAETTAASEETAAETTVTSETAETTETTAEEEPVAGYLIPSRYTGQEIFTARFDGVTQEVDAYTLVCMICATEMSPSFSQEALKAQAVAAYSYVKYHNVNGLTPSVLVKHEVHDATIAAVDAVFGQCAYYDGKVAQTVYTASTAGTTASGRNVWGGGAPYLESVETPIDELYDPNWGIVTTYTEDEMRNKIQNYCGITLSDDPANWIQIQSCYDGRYVDDVLIDGQMTIKGQKFRDGLMHYALKSWAFDVAYADGIFTFTTYGYGHGVGLSQNGANILGRQGYTYDEILKYYFPGITIQ